MAPLLTQIAADQSRGNDWQPNEAEFGRRGEQRMPWQHAHGVAEWARLAQKRLTAIPGNRIWPGRRLQLKLGMHRIDDLVIGTGPPVDDLDADVARVEVAERDPGAHRKLGAWRLLAVVGLHQFDPDVRPRPLDPLLPRRQRRRASERAAALPAHERARRA